MDPLSKMLVDALRVDAERHDNGDFKNLGDRFDNIESYRDKHPEVHSTKNVGIAYTFWDSWIDQVNHGFQHNYYDGIAPDAWPGLAREIADNMEAGALIANPTVLKLFDLTRKR